MKLLALVLLLMLVVPLSFGVKRVVSVGMIAVVAVAMAVNGTTAVTIVVAASLACGGRGENIYTTSATAATHNRYFTNNNRYFTTKRGIQVRNEPNARHQSTTIAQYMPTHCPLNERFTFPSERNTRHNTHTIYH